ncbi:LysR substrate-binding domain-containing protein [Lactobacillus intestinalis]|uniref:LysR substrate-binding domain-containing protein n=1 Tax=Lactobacillus intestinalis TaxID=151781 RepID=UPI00336C1922
MTRKDHPLAQYPRVLLTDLLPYHLITYFPQTSIGKKITSTLLNYNSNLSIAGEGNDELSLATQVLANDGVGIVVNNHFLDSFDIAKIKINLPKNTRTVFLAYNPKVKMSQSIQLLINLLRKK